MLRCRDTLKSEQGAMRPARRGCEHHAVHRQVTHPPMPVALIPTVQINLKDHSRPSENSKWHEGIFYNDVSVFTSMGSSLPSLLWKTFKRNPGAMQVSSAFPIRAPGSSFEVIIMAKQCPPVATISCRDSHSTIPMALRRNISHKPFAF